MSNNIKISTELAPDGQAYKTVTLTNKQGMKISFCDWGATWLSCQVPTAGGLREVLLGCHSLSAYQKQTGYLGATVGRYANRITNSTFKLDGISYQLTPNQKNHQLHGGPVGFDQQRWQIISLTNNQVEFELHSADGDQGFPGNLTVTAIYHLTDNNEVKIQFYAKTDKPTPVNLTNHAYFNLDGDGSGDARRQTLSVDADQYLPVDEDCIAIGGLASVTVDDMDLRTPRQILDNFSHSAARNRVKGYDHAYLLNHHHEVVAKLIAHDQKVTMEIMTNKPGIQVYTGNFLAGTPNRDGKTYQQYEGIALETAFLPNSPNQPNYPQPSCILNPDEQYTYHTTYRFITK